MSSFTGKFREYPSISADNFEKENLSSLAFFLSHCHKDHMSGLDSSAFHQRLKASQTVFVYCSETTRNLLRCDPSYNHLQDYVRSIPMEQQTMIPLVNDDTGENETICVTLLPAGHCVGSVMFLFEGHHGNVLYTGDFRLAKGDVKRIPFFHSNGSIKDIKSIYIDTTFCLPKMVSLPSREQSRDAITEIIDRWFSRGPECVVSLLCEGMYGFEYLLKEVALNYKTKIHVSVERLAMYECLPDMTPHFTTDGKSTRIHACKWQSDRDYKSDLPCGSSVHPSFKTKVLRIKPTSMWVARDSEPMPKDFKRYHKGSRMWRVVHSMHASMEEIQDVVGYLRPYHVFPNVPPAGPDTLEDAFERLRGLTRLEKCDSCNQEESDEILFMEEAGHFNDECTESREEAEQRKILEVARPAPNEQVLAQCKELGLEEEASSAPPPKRRRNKGNKAVAVPEEKPVAARKSPQKSKEEVSKPESIEFQGDGINRDDERRAGHLHKPLEDKSEIRIEPVMMCSTACKSGIEPVMKCSTACSVTCYQLSKRDSPGERKQSKDSEVTCLGSKNDDTTSEERTKNNGQFWSDNDSSNLVERESLTKQQRLTKRVSCLGGVSSQGQVGGELPGAVAEFNVPPSPGHVEPLPDKLSVLHQLWQNREQISNL